MACLCLAWGSCPAVPRFWSCCGQEPPKLPLAGFTWGWALGAESREQLPWHIPVFLSEHSPAFSSALGLQREPPCHPEPALPGPHMPLLH